MNRTLMLRATGWVLGVPGLVIQKLAVRRVARVLVVLGFFACGGCATRGTYHYALGSLREDRIETIQSASIDSNALTIVASGVLDGIPVEPLVLRYPLPPASSHAACTGDLNVIYIDRDLVRHALPPPESDACHVETQCFTNREGHRTGGWIISDPSGEHGRTFDVFQNTAVRVKCGCVLGRDRWMSLQPDYHERLWAVPLLPIAVAADAALWGALAAAVAFGGGGDLVTPAYIEDGDFPDFRDQHWIPSAYHSGAGTTSVVQGDGLAQPMPGQLLFGMCEER